MSFELSLPVKIAALGGLVLALGAGAMLLLFAPHTPTSEVVIAPVHRVATKAAHTAPGVRAKATAHAKATHPVLAGIDPTLPASIRQALAHHQVVVAILYSGTNPFDRDAEKLYRLSAAQTNAGVAILNVAKEKTAEAVLRAYPGAVTPGLLIIRRPGKVVTQLDGMQDSLGILQAISNAGGGAKSANASL